MNHSLLSLLRCPKSGEPLKLVGAKMVGDDIVSGMLVSELGATYPITRSIPRFVPATNYASNFGVQWNRFRQTQLDSHSGQSISHDRFYSVTGWNAEDLRGARVLDVGCGAGRFAEVALKAGACVVAVDYSNAVDACQANHAAEKRLDVVQANVYGLPFAPGSFDFVYCLGVLHHTPDVHASFHALPPMLRVGGRLGIDIYPELLSSALLPTFWLRRLTPQMDPEKLLQWVERTVPVLLPISRLLGRLPFVGRQARKIIPVANYEGVLPLSREQLKEWAMLDTFDMLAPRYEKPQSVETVREWFRTEPLTDVVVQRAGFVIGRGTRT